MLRLKIVALVLFMYCQKGVSQKQDSTIFLNSFEKKLFQNFVSGAKVDPLDLFLAQEDNNQSESIKTTLNSFIKNLDEQGIGSYPRKKQIKEIYNQVHNRFFKKYSEIAYFPEIFKTGNYNCLTASALYAMVLDYFRIEYQIKETPNHVYLIADPKGTSFMMETTLPSKGVYEFDERFKKNYVDYLVSNKIISEIEYKTNSIDDLFDKNYQSDKSINLIQLAGLQYFNKGVTAYNSTDYSSAALNLEKARIIYHSTNIRYLYSNSLLLLLNEQNSKKKFDGKTLAKYANTNKPDNEAIKLSIDHFKDISSEMVINHPDIKGYNQVYGDLYSYLSDSIDKSEYSQTYHDLLAYYYYTRNEFEQVFRHAGASYKINPDNIRTQQFLTEGFFKYIQQAYPNEAPPCDSLLKYSSDYPILINNGFYMKMLAATYAFNMMPQEIKSSGNDAREIHQQFISFIRQLANNDSNTGLIEAFYDEASSALVKNANYDKAEELIREGLLFVPNSIGLKGKLETISSSKTELKKYIRTSKTYTNYSFHDPVKPPEFNAEIVNANVKKYLVKCWNLNAISTKNPKNTSNKETLKFIFYPDGKVKFKAGTEEHWGVWKYQNNNSTLILENNEDKEKFSILIYDASENQMKGMMAVTNEFEGKKVVLTACKK